MVDVVTMNRTKRIALIGTLSAISVLCVFLTSIMPTGRLSLFTVSSFLVSIIIIEYGDKQGWIFYIVTNLIAYILIPNKIGIVVYTSFFGIYGILKHYIESINNMMWEYVLKYTFFNTCIVFVLLVFKVVINRDITIGTIGNIKFTFWIVIAIAEVIFFIYDYIYTLFVQYYKHRLRRFL